MIAVIATGAAFLARVWLSKYLGPPYILFYPTVMLVAVLLGLGPGLVATALASLFAALWILPLERQFTPIPTRDMIGLALFTSMGVFMSIVAHLYRQARERLVANENVRAVTQEHDARVRASEERLRAITDTIPDPVFVKGRDSRMLLANPATTRAIGKPADEVLGRTDREFYDDPEVGAAILSTDRRIMDSGVAEVVEERVQTPNGYRVFLSTKAPYRDVEGRVIGLIGVARDITERKVVEDALRRSEAILAQAGGMAHVGAWWIDISNPDDLDANPLHWSDEAYRIFGYAPGAVEVTNALFFESVHPDDRHRVAEAVQKALATKTPYEIEHRSIRPDGSERVVLEHAEFAYDGAGHPVRLFGAVQDITERKRSEQELRESEQRYSVIFEASPFAIALTRMPEVTTVGVNDAFLKLFEYERNEVVGKRSVDLGISDADSHERVRAALQRDGFVRDFEVTRRTRSGAQRVLSINLDRVTIAGQELVLTTIQDITDRKHAEEALREADRRKSEFLGVLSHELRNPLAPIRNALYILDGAAAGGEQAERAKAVVGRQVDHLTRLVDDLLDVTRISRGKVTLQRSRFDLREVVQRTVEDHQHVLSGREVGVDVRVAPGPLFVEADATRVSQILGNLLQNSAKFTDAGGRITVTVERGRDRVSISVRDTGIGVAADMLGRMFEPFTQADDSLHRTRGGLGLGLALVRGLVELHGGTVEAKSDGLGRGTEVIVRLPLAPPVGEAPEGPRSVPGPARPLRVLIIEDNLDAAETLREMLEMWHHEVAVAHAGRQGIERARAFQPEIVLCDIGLPELDGYEVARTIRADPALASAVLVAVTGYALPEDQRRAAEAGFEFHIAKPVSVAQIEDVLARGGRRHAT